MLSALLHGDSRPGEGRADSYAVHHTLKTAAELDRVGGMGRQCPGPKEPESRRLACPRWA